VLSFAVAAPPIPDEQEKAFQNEEALVLLGAWGKGSQIDKVPFQGHPFVIRGYHPAWAPVPADEEAVTLLSARVGHFSQFKGHRLFGSYPTAEKECPHLGDPDHQKGCDLCRGDNYIYWGEGWRVVVLLKDPGSELETES
jgi:hypothetical protein